MNTTSRLLSSIIAASNGTFFTVSFVKKDGTLRTMNCRSGVRKHTKGGASTLDSDKFFTVYDVQKQGYRAINKDTIVSVRVKGVEAVAA
jgi:hypothetical protein